MRRRRLFRSRTRAVLSILAGAALVVAVGVSALFARDMRRAYERIRGKSTVVPSRFGDIEYSEGGSGPAVLVVHGSGGGFDQSELMVRTVLSDRVHWIAPSRFGYLRSTFHDGATFDDQADAYDALLSHLGIGEADVVALSHGGPSALLFAARHPDRVRSLTLISAGVAASSEASQDQANQKGNRLTAVFQRDYRYWAFTTAFRGMFLELMGATDEVVAGLTPGQRAAIDELVDGMNPVSQRAAGVAFDNRAAMPNERIAAIRAPTLVVHATDDTLQLFRNAEYAAATIPDARLVRFERGGHLLMVVEQARVRALIEQHLQGSGAPEGDKSVGNRRDRP